ncbi:biotin--[acetyl-CoA-carboxylase] ligase [Bacillus suaedaesalsae]|uniref:Bifunctional ligase/repressor BirA n=1 Tax=Bacillus suaedaesalsae TaxID=2810349 RepID=A0ABS2DMV7_9BACI|nr:biotin--[acetyl-CoA-carboxylase] ligase [Bacillus suaedaesalsae]
MQSALREKLLEVFTQAQGEFVSGQKLSEAIGCSRTAIWKHIEDLRKEGYELEAVRRKGYRIMMKPEKVTSNEIQLGLATKYIGRTIHYEETVESTQKIAHRLSYDNVPEGTIVVADEQLSGRGRLDRTWHSPKFSGVWMSTILRPRIPLGQAPGLTLLAAVAVAQAIEDMTELEPEIKWPNDILINGKKTVGILTEMQAESDRINAIIIGIGINVNQSVEDFPEELREKATSLRIENGSTLNRAELIQAVLMKLEKLYEQFLSNGFYPIKLLWEAYAISIGKRIIASTLRGTITGYAKGITDDGVLMLEDDHGTVHYIHSADIEIER